MYTTEQLSEVSCSKYLLKVEKEMSVFFLGQSFGHCHFYALQKESNLFWIRKEGESEHLRLWMPSILTKDFRKKDRPP